MKKLLCLLLVLLCCGALTAPAFADLILPPDLQTPEATAAAEGTEPPVQASDLAAPAAEAGSSAGTALYLGLGAVAVAAGLMLYRLLKKQARA